LLSLIPDYLLRLQWEIDQTFQTIRTLGLRVASVYIGGGTPSILNPRQLKELLTCINSHLLPNELVEYTLEAGRPDTITKEKLVTARDCGVNRISINPQTLNDEVLARIGRAHTAEDFYRAFHIARESGIKYINTDLIAGLPGDSFASFSKSVDAIMELRPENLTVHTFCVKKSAEVLRRSSKVYSVTGGDAGKCVDYSQIKAMQNGYLPYYMYRQKNTVGNYENVGFSLPGHEGLYNIYMMEEIHSIFAAGAGAVTKLVDNTGDYGSSGNIERLFRHKYPYEYLGEDKNKLFEETTEAFYRKHNMI
jgi:oxygen-independent coproporphyrinogen-3 oxidase